MTTDKLYYVHGRGFHAGYLSIKDNGARLWGDYKQLFTEDEINKLIQSIPNYIIYSVYDAANHKIIYNNE